MKKLLLFLILVATIAFAVAPEPRYMILWVKVGSPADNDERLYQRLEPSLGPHETVYTVTNEQGQVSSTTNVHWTLNYQDYTNAAGVAYYGTCFSNGIRFNPPDGEWYGHLRASNGKSPIGQGALNGILQGQSPNMGGELTDTPSSSFNSNGFFAVTSTNSP